MPPQESPGRISVVCWELKLEAWRQMPVGQLFKQQAVWTIAKEKGGVSNEVWFSRLESETFGLWLCSSSFTGFSSADGVHGPVSGTGLQIVEVHQLHVVGWKGGWKGGSRGCGNWRGLGNQLWDMKDESRWGNLPFPERLQAYYGL